MIRQPARAGSFYPGSSDRCREEAGRLVAWTGTEPVVGGPLLGGIVPHAGWAFSGPVAGQVFAALAAAAQPEAVVLFGAVHCRRGKNAWMFGSGSWETPLGQLQVDERLAERILGHTSLIVDDPYAHEEEHSIEVQLPLIQLALPDCRIVPILVPAVSTATEVGDAVARTIESYGYNAAVVGSTDLTHYGPSYGLVRRDVGSQGVVWAKETNDRRMIELMLALESDRIVPEAAEHHNASGAGAVAATVSAARRLGATRGHLLAHTTSYEVLASPSAQDSVGYAGLVFAADEVA